MFNFMKIRAFLLFLFIILLGAWSLPVSASSLASKLSGRIVLSVEENGEAWYINPVDSRRYYLGRPADAFQVMRELGLGISELNFQEIAQAGMPVDGNTDLAKRLAGSIVLQVEKNGEAWYINPLDLKKYYLGRPEDAFQVMRELGLGISREDLALIHKPGLSESINKYSDYNHSKIETSRGVFTTDTVRIDLSNPSLEILTLGAEDDLCSQGSCATKSLASYVFANDAFAGVNASYFCTAPSCGGVNYYFAPVYNSLSKKMINDDQLKYWTTGPLVAFDENNKFYYFKDSRDFKSVADFEDKFDIKLQAAISNRPRLLENSMNVLIDWETDFSQRNNKLTRNVLAYRENINNLGKGELYLMIIRRATLDDVAVLLQSIGIDYALNLDGGFSSALIYNGEYMVGPGRNIPNAIVFKE